MRNQSITCAYLFTASLIASGILSSTVYILAIIPPNKKAVEKKLASVKGEIIRLGGNPDSIAAAGEEKNRS
ncbi:MAG: hypothetical protein KA785_03420 [Spirochaetaceae bacterium]|nr:hypothetical protein [Spirochaetaceae bacterium]